MATSDTPIDPCPVTTSRLLHIQPSTEETHLDASHPDAIEKMNSLTFAYTFRDIAYQWSKPPGDPDFERFERLKQATDNLVKKVEDFESQTAHTGRFAEDDYQSILWELHSVYFKCGSVILRSMPVMQEEDETSSPFTLLGVNVGVLLRRLRMLWSPSRREYSSKAT